MIIYKTTNLINGKIYIGQYSGERISYLGSGTKLRLAIKKNGKNNFKRETLKECKNQKQLDVWEKIFIDKFDSSNPEIGYNILIGTANKFGSGSPMKIKEVAEKCSKSHMKRFNDNPNLRKELSDFRKNIYDENPEYKKKLSENGKKLTGSKNPNFGNKWTDEMKQAQRDRMLNRYDGKNNPNFGKKWSEEKRKIASENMKGKYIGEKNPNHKSKKNENKKN